MRGSLALCSPALLGSVKITPPHLASVSVHPQIFVDELVGEVPYTCENAI